MSKTEMTVRTEIIDHTSDALGPVWLPRTGGTVQERARGEVLTSGRARAGAGALVTAVASARDTIFVASFLLSDEAFANALLEAAGRGVRVYVLTASDVRLRSEPRGDHDAGVVEQHLALLRRLGGRVLLRSSERFHAKLVLVDGASGPGFLLTANLTKEALERNEEIIVRLTATEAWLAREWFIAAFWSLAQFEMLDSSALRPVTSRPAIDAPPVSRDALTVTWTGVCGHAERLLEIVDGAKRSLVVSCFGWDEHEALVDLIARRAAEIDVVVLARMRERSMPALLHLAASGAWVVGFPWLHAKAISADDGAVAWVGSCNFETRGLDEGFELGVVLGDERAVTVDEVLADWARCGRWELRARATVGQAAPRTTVRRWSSGEFVDVRVEDVRRVELDERSGARVPTPSANTIVHRTEISWRSRAVMENTAHGSGE
jgi:cardiolipin synthase